MKTELIWNCALSLTKKEIIKHGIKSTLEIVVKELISNASNDFVDLVDNNLEKVGNNYQFILTIKKLES